LHQIESQAGLVIEGPDTDSITFTVDKQNNYTVNYLSVTMGNCPTAEDARNELMMFMSMRPWTILGQQLRLMKQAPWTPPGVTPTQQLMAQQVSPFPMGTILIWRKGQEPVIKKDGDTWSGSMTYALLPPFCQLVEK